MGLTVMQGKAQARITKDMAHCVTILLPARPKFSPAGLIMGETPQHWEYLSSNGCVIRCHSVVEAQEAAMICGQGVAEGQFLAVGIAPYTPRADDLPYHDWIRGVRGKKLSEYGLTLDDLPEAQDPGVARISDSDWLSTGPR